MEFACLNDLCLRTHHFSDPEPGEWDHQRTYARLGEYRHKCPWCGAAMAPVSFFPLRNGRRQLVPADYFSFSDCPNAGYCYQRKMYRPDCETSDLKKDCLHGLYDLLTEADIRLQCVEQLVEDLRNGRSQYPPPKRV